MIYVFLVLAMGGMNLLFFYLGLKLGDGEKTEVKLPNLNPIIKYKEHKEKEEARKEQEKIDVIMQNIDCYDGTSNGQKDIPM